MNLLIVSSRFPFGTKESYLRTELEELARHFRSVSVVPVRTPRGSRTATQGRVKILPWPTISLGILARAILVACARPGRTFHVLWRLAKSRDRGRAKNAVVALKGLALAHWAMEHSIGHIHAYWLSTPATVAMIAGTIADIPWSATAHRWDIYERNALDVKASSIAFVRTISDRGSRDLQDRNPRLNGRVVCLPLGAVVPAAMEERVQSAHDPFRIVCPAALVPVKGHEDLIEAVSVLCARGLKVECTLAGDGPLRERLEWHVKQRGLDESVRFAGFVPQAMLHDWYRTGRANAVVLASRENEREMEGIPSALIEAMAHGIPVVATTSGSITELLDENCGHLVSPQDPASLASALQDVHDRPFEAYARAVAAYLRVAQTHDVRRQMRDLSERILS